MTDVLIFGATTLAKLAYHYAVHDCDDLKVVGFVVDDCYRDADTFLGLPLIGWSEAGNRFPADSHACHVAVGYRDMNQRAAIAQRVKWAGYAMPSIVSRHSYVAAGVEPGENNLIMPGVVIEPGVRLGFNNVVWSNATVCHDSSIGNHNFIAANVTLGGHVTVGDKNFFGFSSVVFPWVTIGDETTIGSQSMLRCDPAIGATYYGIPAQRQDNVAQPGEASGAKR